MRPIYWGALAVWLALCLIFWATVVRVAAVAFGLVWGNL